MILVNSRKTVLLSVRPGMLHSGQYGPETISFTVTFEFAVPTAVVVDYLTLRPLRSPQCSYDLTGILKRHRNSAGVFL